MHLAPHPARRVVSKKPTLKLYRFAGEILLLTLALVFLYVGFTDFGVGLAQSLRANNYSPPQRSSGQAPRISGFTATSRSSDSKSRSRKKSSGTKSAPSTVGLGLNFVTPDHKGGVWLSGDAFQLQGLLVNNRGDDLQTVTVQGVWTASELRFVSPDIGWMTDYQSLYQSVNSGKSWSRIDAPVVSSISCLHFKDSQNGWVGGLNGEIYRTTDGGQAWKKYSTGLDYQIKQIVFVDLLNGWANAFRLDSGLNGMSALLKTADGGETWEILSNVDFGSPQSVRSLLFLNTREGWAIDTLQHNVVRTEDAGKTWRIQQDRENRGWNSLTFIDDKEGWAAGADGIIHTTDGGKTWEYQIEPESSLLTCFLEGGITFVDRKKGWAVCRSGGLRTTDGGDTWKPISKDWMGMVPSFDTIVNDTHRPDTPPSSQFKKQVSNALSDGSQNVRRDFGNGRASFSKQDAGEARVKQLLQTLEPDNTLRLFLQQGRRGDGIHHWWMDTMRTFGIRQATFEIDFEHRIRNADVKIKDVTYLTTYYRYDTALKDNARLERIRATGLEQGLESEILSRARKFLTEQTQLGSRGTCGKLYMNLLDDEVLPILDEPFDMEDCKVTSDGGETWNPIADDWQESILDKALKQLSERNNPVAISTISQVEEVSFCELANNPERYANRPIKTSAIFLTHFPDVWFMYDENCSQKSNRVTDYLDCKSDKDCDRLRTLSVLHGDGDGEKFRNKMVVVGELQIVERQTRTGAFVRALKFRIADIEDVSAVPQNVLWP